ncbi:MAG: dihydroorotase [Myxococcales bacterium]
MSERIIIRGGTVVDPAQGLEAVRTVVVEGEAVREIVEGPGPAPRPGDELVDASGRWVVPGFVDLHCHLREPGEEGKETIETGGRAAAAGGFTRVVAMPNTRPPIDSGPLVEWVAARAKATAPISVHPAGAVSAGQAGETLAELSAMREAGAVVFTDDGRPIANAALMRRALEWAKLLGVPVMTHEEDPHLSAGAAMNEGPTATRLGLRGSPVQAEEVMVCRDLALCELTSGRLHLGHLSAAGSVRALRAAKARGLPVTAEATPHHFTLTDEAVAGYDTDAKMAPPLRGRADVEAIREGLRDGTLDAIATDHAPHGPTDKEVEFDRAANGVVGLETAFALGHRLVQEGVLSRRRLVELLTCGPARAYALPGGTLRPGLPADLAVIDPLAEWTVDPARFLSKGRNTPFKGQKLRGRVTLTLVAGRVIHRLADPEGSK